MYDLFSPMSSKGYRRPIEESTMGLSLPSWVPFPSPTLLFLIALASYAVVSGGVVYCTITGMPFMGTTVDERGNQKPQAIMTRGRGQYLGEGLAVGSFFALGGIGFIVLERMNCMVNPTRLIRTFLALLGLFCLVGSTLAVRSFIGMKDKWYFQASSF